MHTSFSGRRGTDVRKPSREGCSLPGESNAGGAGGQHGFHPSVPVHVDPCSQRAGSLCAGGPEPFGLVPAVGSCRTAGLHLGCRGPHCPPPKAGSRPPCLLITHLEASEASPHLAVSPGASPRQALRGQLQAKGCCPDLPWWLVTVLGREIPSSSEGGMPPFSPADPGRAHHLPLPFPEP